MTNQSPESVIAEALNKWQEVSGSDINLGVADYLVAALHAANMLRESGVPDAATEQAVAEGDRCIDQAMKRVEVAEAERDAALAAIGRVRARLGDILPDWSDSGVIAVADILAALDGAPEPEWEYVGVAFEHGGFIRIRNDQLVPEKFESWRKLVAQYPRVEILKRVKAVPAGPWLPVEGESKP